MVSKENKYFSPQLIGFIGSVSLLLAYFIIVSLLDYDLTKISYGVPERVFKWKLM